MEFRAVAQEFLLRIRVVDLDTRITIKVLPSLSVGDVISMIQYNLRNRHIDLETFHRGGIDPFASPLIKPSKRRPDRKTNHYALYIPSRSIWLQENKTLEEYQLVNMLEEVHLKIQYRPILIALPDYMIIHRHDDVLVSTNSRGEPISTRFIQVFVPEPMRVRDLVSMLNLDNSFYQSDVTSLSVFDNRTQLDVVAYRLFTCGGERLNDDEMVWSCVKDLSSYVRQSFKNLLHYTLVVPVIYDRRDPGCRLLVLN